MRRALAADHGEYTSLKSWHMEVEEEVLVKSRFVSRRLVPGDGHTPRHLIYHFIC